MVINPTTNMTGEITLLGAIISIALCIILVVIFEIVKRKSIYQEGKFK